MSNPGFTLYQLPAELEAIHEALIQNGGELTAELEERLETVQGTLDVKVENTCRLIRELETAALAPRDEIRRLQERARTRENAAARLKEYLKSVLEALGIEKMKTATFNPRVQASPWAVRLDPQVGDPVQAGVPESWLKPPAPRELDAKAVVAAWEQCQAAWEQARDDGRIARAQQLQRERDALQDEFYRTFGFRAEERQEREGTWPLDTCALREQLRAKSAELTEAVIDLPASWNPNIIVTRGSHLRF